MNMGLRTRTPPGPILPGQPQRRTGLIVLFVLLGVVIVGSAAVIVRNYTRGSPSVSIPPAGQAPPSPTLPPDSRAAIKAAVIDAYKQSYEGFFAVGKERAPDLNDPRLIQYSTGAALLAKQRALAQLSAKGQIYAGDIELHPTVLELGPDTATVTDCSVDTTALVDGRTGVTIVGGGARQPTADTAKLKLDGGVWKVTDFKDEKRPCTPAVGT